MIGNTLSWLQCLRLMYELLEQHEAANYQFPRLRRAASCIALKLNTRRGGGSDGPVSSSEIPSIDAPTAQPTRQPRQGLSDRSVSAKSPGPAMTGSRTSLTMIHYQRGLKPDYSSFPPMQIISRGVRNRIRSSTKKGELLEPSAWLRMISGQSEVGARITVVPLVLWI